MSGSAKREGRRDYMLVKPPFQTIRFCTVFTNLPGTYSVSFAQINSGCRAIRLVIANVQRVNVFL